MAHPVVAINDKSGVRLINVMVADVLHTVTAVYSGLAIDVQRHLLYFTDEGQGRVGELELKPELNSDVTSRVIDSTPDSRPRAIAVDTVNRYRAGSFLARDVIYISPLWYDVSVRLSVTEVHWRIIANLDFKFRSYITAHCGRGAYRRELFIIQCARGEGSSPGRVEGSSRAMLATARPSS